MPKKPVTIGDHDFESMKEAKAHCKEIADRLWAQKLRVRKQLKDDRFVPVRTREDRDFLAALVQRHPLWEHKQQQIKDMKGTIKGFAVGKIEFEKGPARVCFWLSTADEPKAVPFSAGKCVSKK